MVLMKKYIRLLFSYILPGLILSFLCMTFILKPVFLFRNIFYGWWIAAFVIPAVVCLGIGAIFHYVWEVEFFSTGVVNFFYAVITIVIVSCSCVGTIGVKDLKLSTKDDFNLLMNLPNGNRFNYTLENNIDFNFDENLQWIGKIDFYGVFNGNHHTISNIHATLKPEPSPVTSSGAGPINGIFTSNSGTICNLKLENCNITIQAYSSNHQSYGILVGINLGTINNIIMLNNKIEVMGGDNLLNVGGVCGSSNCNGYTDSIITNIAIINTKEEFGIFSEKGDCGAIAGILFPCTLMENLFIYKAGEEFNQKPQTIAGCIAGGNWDSTLKKWEVKNCLYHYSKKLVGIKFGDTYERDVKYSNCIQLSDLDYEDLPKVFKSWNLTRQGFLIPCTGFK